MRIGQLELGMRIDLRIDVTVGDDEVLVPVIVQIREDRSPGQGPVGHLADAGCPGDVVEEPLPVAPVHRREVLGEVRDDDV